MQCSAPDRLFRRRRETGQLGLSRYQHKLADLTAEPALQINWRKIDVNLRPSKCADQQGDFGTLASSVPELGCQPSLSFHWHSTGAPARYNSKHCSIYTVIAEAVTTREQPGPLTAWGPGLGHGSTCYALQLSFLRHPKVCIAPDDGNRTCMAGSRRTRQL